MSAIAFVTKHKDTFTNPTLMSIFHKLGERNIKTFLFGNFINSPFLEEEGLNIYFCNAPSPFVKWPRRPAKLIRETVSLFKVINECKKNNVKWLLAIDPFGLVITHRILRFYNAKLVYLSFEIFFRDEAKTNYYVKLLSLERMISTNVDILVVQDEARESLLRSELALPEKCKTFLIPVSYSKYVKNNLRKHDLYKHYNIPKKSMIVVHSGSFSEWTYANELIDSISKWPKNFWLIIHNNRKIDIKSCLVKKINALIDVGAPITLTDEPLNCEEYFNFLSGCHIGLALYKPGNTIYTGNNIKEIGLSSGKFNTYSMLGLPIIATFCTSFEELNKQYDYGFVMRSFTDLPLALENIHKNYDKKIRGSLYMYDQVLEPDAKVDELISLIST